MILASIGGLWRAATEPIKHILEAAEIVFLHAWEGNCLECT